MLSRAFRRLVALVLMVTVLSATTVAQAGLNEALGFMVNTTSPGVVSSRDRGALIGGSVSIRAPINTVNLFYFDPPRLNAGCGGIDMYLGSFSFINADAFKGMLKSIAQAAAGYFFKLALQAICPPCEAILSSLQDLATILNNSAMNACKIGRDLARWGMDAFDRTKKAFEGSTETALSWVGSGGNTITSGALGGWFDNFMKIFTNPQQAKTDALNYTPESGNAVWKAIVSSGAGGAFNPNGGNVALGEVEMANLIISLLGTVVVAPLPLVGENGYSTYTNADLQANALQREALCSGASANQNACDAGGAVYERLLTFRALVDGPTSNTQKWYRCYRGASGGAETDLANPMGCLKPKEEDFAFIGTKRYVNKYLFCAPTTNVPLVDTGATDCWNGMSVEPGSIISNITSGVPLPPAQIAFLNNFRMPVIRLLMETQRSRQAAEQTARALAPHMANEMALAIGNTMTRIAGKAFSGNTDTNVQEAQKAALVQFRMVADEMAVFNDDFARVIIETTELAQKVRAMDPVVVSSVVRRR